MKLSELRAILELSQLTHPGNAVLECVLQDNEDGCRSTLLGVPSNVATVRDLLPSDTYVNGAGTVRLKWELDQ